MSEPIKAEFGKWLKPLIESLKAKYSQGAIAKKAGITPTHLSRIVTGESGVKRETAISIIDTINDLAGNEIANKKFGLALAGFTINDEDPELVEIFNKLTKGVMASGFNNLKDQDLREAFYDDMWAIAEASLKRRLTEQEKRNK